MHNISLSISDDLKLTVVIDLTAEHGRTRSERSVSIASTKGNLVLWKDNKPLPQNIRLNLNCIRSLTDEEKHAKQERNTSNPFSLGLHGRLKR